uniref:Enoyl-CoA hydratase n=1 Tax=Oryza brachyantha TaxID=4533 RepID=J3MD98_ORYBR
MALLYRLPFARAVLLSAAGPHFCIGLDLGSLGDPVTTGPSRADLPATEGLRRTILEMQAALTAIEQCRKLVVTAGHDACVGGGVEVVAACDIQCCSKDAMFVLKKVDMAIIADLGALQQLPRIVGYGNTADIALTSRMINAMEAKEMGLVNRVFDSKQVLCWIQIGQKWIGKWIEPIRKKWIGLVWSEVGNGLDSNIWLVDWSGSGYNNSLIWFGLVTGWISNH